MNCVIVDDDAFARKSLQLLCDKVESLNVLAEFPSALEAIEGLRERSDIDVVFLDIHMPELSGFDFLKSVKQAPKVIFTTSDPSKALEAFEVDALDYLIKPVALPRFLKAIERLNPEPLTVPANNGQLEAMDEYDQEIFVNVDRRLTRLNTADIALVEAKGDYVLIKMSDGKHHIVRSTMKNIAARLSPAHFIKVHRSFLVNLSQIKDIEDSSMLIANQVVPISRNLKAGLMGRLNTL